MNSVLPRETDAALAGKMAILFPNSRSCRASRLSAKYGLALRVPLYDSIERHRQHPVHHWPFES
jgi:hypothetical protein